jgi:AbrB family looped-hinge helix DNA binding protein
VDVNEEENNRFWVSCSIKTDEEKPAMKVRVSSKGRITLPAALRRKYGIKDGTRIIISDLGNAIALKPVTEQYLMNLQGSLKVKGGLKVLTGERRKDRSENKH